MHELMASTLDTVIEEIKGIQRALVRATIRRGRVGR
jgi:phosphoketolase